MLVAVKMDRKEEALICFQKFSTNQKQNERYLLFTKYRTFDESTQRMVLEESSVR